MRLNFWDKLFKTEDNYTYTPFENGIEVLNFWPGQASKDLWLYHFVTARFGDILHKDNSLLLSSLFGEKSHIRKSPSKTKVFFSGENLARFPKYRDYCADFVDVSIGFDYIHRPGYVRFPLWLLFLFEADSTYASIKAKVDGIRQNAGSTIADKQRFCSLICSHDKNGNRKKLFELISTVEKVDSAGKFMNNTDSLKKEFHDNKVDFLRQYKFNICPENTDRHGYVTEKVFEAIQCGCIPIYWGDNNNPEPAILNKEAILFYDKKNPAALLNKVKTLQTNPQAYTDFVMQDRFRPDAADRIYEMFVTLENSISMALSKHR
ncbi:glycosyltransferase family 10 domain-containing protein [Chitinophaga varians]|uniref:glycosyltransferase family 10 domain-containing protein n=1 Tax=Chitinophaga varians TaxID=2202339 RepID=UPI00165FBCCD|nr:glycosyltransferase family 10 [Chitinophaga varians]MBC9913035.1 hypothetical protein [Chitinophaga varians]